VCWGWNPDLRFFIAYRDPEAGGRTRATKCLHSQFWVRPSGLETREWTEPMGWRRSATVPAVKLLALRDQQFALSHPEWLVRSVRGGDVRVFFPGELMDVARVTNWSLSVDARRTLHPGCRAETVTTVDPDPVVESWVVRARRDVNKYGVRLHADLRLELSGRTKLWRTGHAVVSLRELSPGLLWSRFYRQEEEPDVPGAMRLDTFERQLWAFRYPELVAQALLAGAGSQVGREESRA
jgi:hypothetical protein